LADAAPRVPVEPVLADITRPALMQRVCRLASPDVVFHAAAYKHVAMMERDVCAAVSANVLGTVNVTRAARAAGARLVLVSSDKAASPRSVMGATKRLAEMAVLAAAGPRFRPIVVRFGNVLGSSGSLLTILRDCVRRGRPLPVTDPEATRYFMTAGEAVSLMMKADVLATRPQVYWLDMGTPVAIGELAERLLAMEEAAGYRRVPIAITGLTPGEKLREELTSQGLRLCPTPHRRIWVARQRAADLASVRRTVDHLRQAVEECDARAALDALVAGVPGFEASEQAGAWARRHSQHVARRTPIRRIA
jgi:FlaA1/EpsC-like NDP-sugar epimerase